MLELLFSLVNVSLLLFGVICKVISVFLIVGLTEIAFQMMVIVAVILLILMFLWILMKMLLRKENKSVVIRIRVIDKEGFDMPFVDREAAKAWVTSLQKGTYEWYKELKPDGTLIHFSTSQ